MNLIFVSAVQALRVKEPIVSRESVIFSERNQPVTTTMQPGNCFYLHQAESDHTRTPLALNCDANGCGLEEFVYDDKSQQFSWDEASGKISSGGKFLTYGTDKNLALGDSGSKWFYKDGSSALTTKIDGMDFRAIAKGDYRNGQTSKWTNVGLEGTTDGWAPENANG